MIYLCPSCNREARLAVEVTTLLNLQADGRIAREQPYDPGDVPALVEGGAAICRDCGYFGTLAAFRAPEPLCDCVACR